MRSNQIVRLVSDRIEHTNYKPISKIYYNRANDCVEPKENHIIVFGTNYILFVDVDTNTVDWFTSYGNVNCIEFDDGTSLS